MGKKPSDAPITYVVTDAKGNPLSRSSQYNSKNGRNAKIPNLHTLLQDANLPLYKPNVPFKDPQMMMNGLYLPPTTEYPSPPPQFGEYAVYGLAFQPMYAKENLQGYVYFLTGKPEEVSDTRESTDETPERRLAINQIALAFRSLSSPSTTKLTDIGQKASRILTMRPSHTHFHKLTFHYNPPEVNQNRISRSIHFTQYTPALTDTRDMTRKPSEVQWMILANNRPINFTEIPTAQGNATIQQNLLAQILSDTMNANGVSRIEDHLFISHDSVHIVGSKYGVILTPNVDNARFIQGNAVVYTVE